MQQHHRPMLPAMPSYRDLCRTHMQREKRAHETLTEAAAAPALSPAMSACMPPSPASLLAALAAPPAAPPAPLELAPPLSSRPPPPAHEDAASTLLRARCAVDTRALRTVRSAYSELPRRRMGGNHISGSGGGLAAPPSLPPAATPAAPTQAANAARSTGLVKGGTIPAPARACYRSGGTGNMHPLVEQQRTNTIYFLNSHESLRMSSDCTCIIRQHTSKAAASGPSCVCLPLMCCKKATSPELPQCGAVTSSDFLESRVIQQQKLIAPVDATCGAPNDVPQVRVTVRGNGLRALSNPWGKRTRGCPPRSIRYRRCSIICRASDCTLYQDTVLLVCRSRWCAKAPWVRRWQAFSFQR